MTQDTLEVTMAKTLVTNRMSRKAMTLTNVSVVSYDLVKIIEESMDLGVIFSWRNLWDNEVPELMACQNFDKGDIPQWFTFTYDNHYYIVNTEGYDYMRYVAEISGY